MLIKKNQKKANKQKKINRKNIIKEENPQFFFKNKF